MNTLIRIAILLLLAVTMVTVLIQNLGPIAALPAKLISKLLGG